MKNLVTFAKFKYIQDVLVNGWNRDWWKVIICKATFTRLKWQELKGGSIAVIIDLQTSKQIRRSEWNAAFKLVFAEIELK